MFFFNTCRTKYYRITTYFILLSAGSYAQQYNPFDGNAKVFHVNLSRYFKTPAEELASRKLLSDSVKMFENDNKWNTSNLYFHLNRYEELLTSLKKHYQYYRLASYINNKDTSGRSELNQISKSINTVDNKMIGELQRLELNSLTNQQFKQLGLTKYAYLIKQTKQDAIHNLSSHDEQLADKLSGNMLDHLTDRYDNLMDSIAAEIIAESKKTKHGSGSG